MCESFQSAANGPMMVPTSAAVSSALPLLRRRSAMADEVVLFAIYVSVERPGWAAVATWAS